MAKKQPQQTFEKPSCAAPGLLVKHYNGLVAQGHIEYEPAQMVAIHHLQTLLDNLTAAAEYGQKSILRKVFSAKPANYQSLYLYGNVGRGKSMLMDLFFDACPIREKKRVHFHAFMQDVHTFIHHWRKQNSTDAVAALAEHIRASELLLCFDEFHVSDIADAMILLRLFKRLFELGIVVVITSNCHPNELYHDGLQRDLFLPFVGLLQQKAQVIELLAKQDYRLSHLQALKTTYHYPLDEKAAAFVRQSYNELTHFAPQKPGVIEVLGRKVVLSAVHGNVALTSFDELCMHALGPADYLEIGSCFDIVILADIPKLTVEKCNEAKRFVTLIDALYEHKVKLICTAEVPAQELYTTGEGAFEFERTVSRLIDMQSESYWRSEHDSR
ncbi:MAG: cell division protein ZapE [Methylobacter sp.]|nr:cell division protein ZapE [Methylobacter sp.]MDP2099615.1 cell division protein ZapE [Methylobacter sp.]MDP2429811.1 cell division protein ZapE [Methylobacter sp.]MDP3055531.1 cell division protein ZapE [Methylobacter sp.]MDP3361337.1 cell division protein ZapE [Methylobacter sp.]